MKLTATFTSIFLSISSYHLYASDFIEPPMVSIPAGKFFMGSDRGKEEERPVRNVSVPAFQMGKYEVTVAEFTKFIEDTNYEMPNNCYQYVLGGPREELASWDTNVYKFSDYHPVVCLPQKAAVDYAKWLSKKTGKSYRLPTEAEWEYTVRAGTSSLHFFGDENSTAKSCQYANVSEWYASTMSATIFEGAYVRDVEQCSDNEATLSTVGLYEPNPFGVYDMVGNVMEYLADCYVNSYENAPTDGSAVKTKECKTHSVRGGSWHWVPFNSSQRSNIGDDFLGALEGFRLALDTSGKDLPAEQGTEEFVRSLAKAQAKVKKKHSEIPAFPNKPRGLQVVSATKQQVSLNWQSNGETYLSGYRVYRQNPLTNKKAAISGNISNTEFIDNSPLPHNAIYSIVALNGKTASISSKEIDSGLVTTHILPTKIEGESYSVADNALVKFSVSEPEDDKIIASIDDRKVSYQVKVAKPQKFQLDARIYHNGQDQQVEIWLGDKKLVNAPLSGERGWRTISNIVELPQGLHALSVKAEQQQFAINWLNVKPI